MNQVLIQYIQQHLLDNPDTDLSSEEDLLGSGLVDSMGMVKLISFIEEEFDISIPPQDMIIENFMTVGFIENYIAQRKSD
jgi:acyl carrier protein